MNYQHSYHAGGFADVFKHWILTLLLEKLQQKPTSFGVLDTHAGSGFYDLMSEKSQKTLEYEGGIGKLIKAKDIPVALQTYLNLIQVANAEMTQHGALSPCGIGWSQVPAERVISLRYYPGSPYLILVFVDRSIQASD